MSDRKLEDAHEEFGQATRAWIKSANKLFDTGMQACIDEIESLTRIVGNSILSSKFHLKNAHSWDDIEMVNNKTFDVYAMCDARTTTKLEYFRYHVATIEQVTYGELNIVCKNEQRALSILIREMPCEWDKPNWKTAYEYMEYIEAKNRLRSAIGLYTKYSRLGEPILLSEDSDKEFQVKGFKENLTRMYGQFTTCRDTAHRKINNFAQYVHNTYIGEEEYEV
jgi:hypothetical protein